MLPEIEAQIGAPLIRVVADRGYPGHNAPPDMKFKIYIAGQKRRVTEAIKRELRRRSAVEPVIGHAKAEHRMGRNFLKGAHGDAANAVLAAAGYNFRRLLAWLAAIWRALVMAVLARPARNPSSRSTTPEAQIPARPHQTPRSSRSTPRPTAPERRHCSAQCAKQLSASGQGRWALLRQTLTKRLQSDWDLACKQ